MDHASCHRSGDLAGWREGGRRQDNSHNVDSLQSGFRVFSLEVLKQKAKERGWETLESVSNLGDNKQFEQLQSMIQRKVDGIIIVPTDNKATIPAIREANKAKTRSSTTIARRRRATLSPWPFRQTTERS